MASLAAPLLSVASYAQPASAATTDVQGITSNTLASTLLPAGYLSTKGNQIVDQNGNDVRIASVGVFTDVSGDVSKIVSAGFNTLRVEWGNSSMQSDIERGDKIVAAAGQVGLKVIFDHHYDEGDGNCDAQQQNGLWFDSGPGTDGTDGCGASGTVSAARFQSDWVAFAQHYAGNPTVIGFDLDNEPVEGDSGQTVRMTWGDGGVTDIHKMFTDVGNAIEAVDPGVLIICEGPINYAGDFAGNGDAPEEDLSVAGTIPVVLNTPNKVVYSVHEYPQPGLPGGDSGSSDIQRMNNAWGYLETQNIAPVWIGEMGASMDGNNDAGSDQGNQEAWETTLVPYLNGQDASQGGPSFTGTEQGVSTDWWCWGNWDGGSPDGTLNDDGSLRAAQYFVYSQLQYHTGDAGTPSAVPVTVAAASAPVSPIGYGTTSNPTSNYTGGSSTGTFSETGSSNSSGNASPSSSAGSGSSVNTANANSSITGDCSAIDDRQSGYAANQGNDTTINSTSSNCGAPAGTTTSASSDTAQPTSTSTPAGTGGSDTMSPSSALQTTGTAATPSSTEAGDTAHAAAPTQSSTTESAMGTDTSLSAQAATTSSGTSATAPGNVPGATEGELLTGASSGGNSATAVPSVAAASTKYGTSKAAQACEAYVASTKATGLKACTQLLRKEARSSTTSHSERNGARIWLHYLSNIQASPSSAESSDMPPLNADVLARLDRWLTIHASAK